MDSLRLGMLALLPPPDARVAMLERQRQERLQAREWQHQVLGWITARNLGTAEIAAAIGVGVHAVCSVLNGREQLPPAWIKRLSHLLEVTPEELQQAWRPWRKKRKRAPLLTPQEEEARVLIAELMAGGRIRQQDLARAIGVTQSEISLVLSGSRRLPEAWKQALADFFCIPAERLGLRVSVPVQPRPKRRRRKILLTRREERSRTLIARLLKENKVRQLDLARALNVGNDEISKAIHGYRRIPPSWYPQIAVYFNLSLDVFEKL